MAVPAVGESGPPEGAPTTHGTRASHLADAAVVGHVCLGDIQPPAGDWLFPWPGRARLLGCLLYTSDAADDLLCVDLGGRRIIKKNN